MASEEHKRLANIIKECHEELRKTARKIGPEKAWAQHVENLTQLQTYAQAMETLAGLWENNADMEDSAAMSRIKWIIDYCMSYFLTDKILVEKRTKEEHLNTVLEFNLDLKDKYLPELDKVRLLDVGSCFNPFRHVASFDVIAMDLCPSNDFVYKGDFLKVQINSDKEPVIKNHEIQSLPRNKFDCVVFSLLLEYMPASEQRILCCEKAYELLRYEGILIIITPDSQHVGKNARHMKNWRYTLAKLGFSRIKFEKLPHITCLVFRKSLAKCLTERWADTHKEEYMSFCINTPQDFKDCDENKS
ncbi:unnamed protein product [Hermetia illucens]|uniref:S-adenosylmethionine sensor upstream of mTORC1 n=1 Tax=Hermetia illucens TaxID=343691 RepID=A0A7R8UA05_HERIL|nr:S-adenosylmethionine sensor upstream of mTORC1 [Hermetia illucens]CAD7076928.1 unnamed protein product [Hermetia illucens]